MAEHHPLTLLPRALTEAGFEAASYAQCYRAAVNGTIPVTRTGTGRWTWAPEDLGTIAEGLQLGHAFAA